MSSNGTVDLLMAKTVEKNRMVAPGRKKQYDAMIVTSNREALAADRRLPIRDLTERFDMGFGTMHRILTEDLQTSKAILSYKFDFYMSIRL